MENYQLGRKGGLAASSITVAPTFATAVSHSEGLSFTATGTAILNFRTASSFAERLKS